MKLQLLPCTLATLITIVLWTTFGLQSIPATVCIAGTYIIHSSFQLWARGNADLLKPTSIDKVGHIITPALYDIVSLMLFTIFLGFCITYSMPSQF